MGAAAAFAGAGLGMSVIQSMQQAEAMKQKAEFDSKQYEINAKLADVQGEEATRRGEEAAKAKGIQTKQMLGSQRAGLAAQGLNIDSGSAGQLQEQTAEAGNLDTVTIRNNAWRESWGFKMQAANQRGQSVMNNIATENQVRNTYLTGGINAASYGGKIKENWNSGGKK
jgi:hypothetical protein